MAKQRKPGLWFRSLGIEVVDTTPRMRRVCDLCGAIPEHRRLDLTIGSGRHGMKAVLCRDCADDFIVEFGLEADNAKACLYGDGGGIRDKAWKTLQMVTKTIRARSAERKRARESGE